MATLLGGHGGDCTLGVDDQVSLARVLGICSKDKTIQLA